MNRPLTAQAGWGNPMTITHRDIDWRKMPVKLNRADRRKLAAETRRSMDKAGDAS